MSLGVLWPGARSSSEESEEDDKRALLKATFRPVSRVDISNPCPSFSVINYFNRFC